MKSIDIVIPSAGRPQALRRLLDSLLGRLPSADAGMAITLTVTDDLYSPELGRCLASEHPGLRYLRGPSCGPAANRNHGAAGGAGEWLLFLDDDCVVDSDLLAHYRRAWARTALDGYATRVLEGAILPEGQRPSALHHAPLNTAGGCLWSCNFMIERRLFEVLGGFDPRFPYALEDCDLMQRIRERGEHVLFVRQASVRHPWRAMRPAEIVRHLIGHAVMADKHPAFVRQWTMRHLARALRGRARQYAPANWGGLRAAQWPHVLCDLLSPLAAWGVVRVPPLRRALSRRYGTPSSVRPMRASREGLL